MLQSVFLGKKEKILPVSLGAMAFMLMFHTKTVQVILQEIWIFFMNLKKSTRSTRIHLLKTWFLNLSQSITVSKVFVNYYTYLHSITEVTWEVGDLPHLL